MSENNPMKLMKLLLACLLLPALSPLNGEETSASEAKQPAQSADISKVSEAFGHLIGKNLESIGIKFDIAQVIKGLQDASIGKDSPMTEGECVQAIASVQEKLFKEQCVVNLAQAEGFLAQNGKAEHVVSLENGKVQYKISQPGAGALVEPHYSPLVRYTGKYLDGNVFGEAKEEEMISLDEVIPGLKAGLVGMKEGEKRTIYIHPDMAYGTNGYLPPNSLLTFEIEVVKANAPEASSVDSISADFPQVKGAEIAEGEQPVNPSQ